MLKRKEIWNKIQVYWEEPDFYKAFIAALITVQALTAIGVFSFDSILPYLCALPFLLNRLKKWKLEKDEAGWALGGALLFSATYLVENAGLDLILLILFTGGAVGGVCLKTYLVRWVRTSFLNKIIGALITITSTVALKKEHFIFERLPERGWIGAAVTVLLLYLFLTLAVDFSRSRRKDWAEILTILVALMFAVFSTAGHITAFENDGNLAGLFLTFSLITWWFLFYMSLHLFFEITEKINLVKTEKKNRSWKKIGIVLVVVFLCAIGAFTPYFLAYYPGVVEYDSWVQLGQVLGDPYSNHHPWLHTMIIKFFFEIGRHFMHSENRGVALYSLFSMCLLAGSIACTCAWFYQKGVKARYWIAIAAVYILSPINGIYSIIMWKDIPFAATCLLFLILISWMIDRVKAGKGIRVGWVVFVVLSFLVCFLRSNGLYAYILLIPFLIWLFGKRWKSVLAAIGAVGLLAGLYKGPVFSYFGVAEPDLVESLSIPAQQIAAVVAYEGEITEEQELLLEKVVDVERVPGEYLGSVHCSDSIKNLVRETGNQQYISEHSREFIRLWVQMGLQNKYIYLKAFIDETEGYWYHKVTYWFIWATYIQENASGINRESKLPEHGCNALSAYLKGYEDHFWKYYGSGFFTYLLFFCLYILLRRKRIESIMVVLNVGIWLTLLVATPVYADFRYAYELFLTAPFIMGIALLGRKDRQKYVDLD